MSRVGTSIIWICADILARLTWKRFAFGLWADNQLSDDTSDPTWPIHDARAVCAGLREADVLVWDSVRVRTATEHSGSGFVHNECIYFVETAAFVCGRCDGPSSMTEAVLYP